MEEKEVKQKRKTTTSTKVKRRYNDKVYSRIYADLPKEFVETFKATAKKQGDTTASIFRETMEKYIEKHT